MLAAKELDNTSLRKRRLEILQMVEASLRGECSPALMSWRGFEIALCHFGMCCCYVWRERGNQDALYAQFREKLKMLPKKKQYYPPWLERKDNY